MKKLLLILIGFCLVNVSIAQIKTDPKKTDPKKVDPKKVDPKKVDPKKVDPKKVDPKKVDPKKVDPKKVDPKATNKKDEPPVIEFPKIIPDPIPTRKGEKWSFTGMTATFDQVKPFKPLIRPKKIKVNMLGADGKPVQDPRTKKYNQKDSIIIEEYELYAAVKVGEKWGYVDRTGKVLITPKYYEARSFHNNYAVVSVEEKVKVKVGEEEEEEIKILYGVINDKGVEVVAPKYDNITEVDEDIIDIFDAQKGKMGYYNIKTAKMITDLKYENANPFRDGRAAVRRGSKWGFIDVTGKEVIPPTFDDVKDFGEGLARAYKNLKWGFIDKNGNESIAYKFQNPDEAASLPFVNGMAIVRSSNGEGWIDKKGQFRINAEFSDTRPFYNKLAAIQKADKWGFIDVSGKVIIAPKFAAVGDFGDVGLAPFREGQNWGFIDIKGAVVIKPIYSEVEGTFSRGMVKVKKGNSYLYIDKTGKEY